MARGPVSQKVPPQAREGRATVDETTASVDARIKGAKRMSILREEDWFGHPQTPEKSAGAPAARAGPVG
jgi:hypothetical protein